MKKISTVMAKKDEKNASQKLTIGLDLGDRFSWYCVLNEAGEVVLEQKVATTPKAMKEVFGGMPRSRMALETGGGKNGKKRAVIAVARKLAVLLHRLWVSGEAYEPLRNQREVALPAAA